MSTDSAHHSQWTIAEVVFGIPFLVSLALHYAAPSSLPPGVLRQTLIPVGIALIITGIGLIVAARREFAWYGQPTDPGHPTSRVIKTGVFAISRNPLYLGAALVLLGMALALNLLWSLATLLLSLILCHSILIRPEERYLTAKFGEDYQVYTATVHRWLGRKRVKTRK
jgi:protein-S-isoprenylcysteine O-methyltransferase Ste14